MKLQNFSEIGLSKMISIFRFCTRNEMGHFREPVHNHRYSIFLCVLGKATRKSIHWNCFPRLHRDRKWCIEPLVKLTLGLKYPSSAKRKKRTIGILGLSLWIALDQSYTRLQSTHTLKENKKIEVEKLIAHASNPCFQPKPYSSEWQRAERGSFRR